jgi:hypothetical protein
MTEMRTVSDEAFSTAAEAYEASEDVPANPTDSPTLGDVINRRFGRRDVLRGALGASAIAALSASSLALLAGARPAHANGPRVSFSEIAHGADETHHVAPGYDADILIRWGDPVMPGAPSFDPATLTAEVQEKLFGYNNDFIGFVPLPPGSSNPDHGLLCINHEYTSEALMFPGLGKYDKTHSKVTRDTVEVEMAAHGGSVIEVRRTPGGRWRVVPDSAYNRRITAHSTAMKLTGPAAGHARLKTAEDSSGTRVIGTVNNCAGGITPWGTWLMAEENFNGYFLGDLANHPEARNYKRYGVPGKRYAWGRFHERWDINAEPNEANRFGWIVEVDPLDPSSVPLKRTALGRFKHEGAEPVVNRDGRVVIYSGDDQRFDYLYKFVSHGRYRPGDRRANMALLDSGTLYVAKFEADGSLSWLPMVFGTGRLTPANGFESQADVLIETRRAADILGATPMDRPEDVDPNPKTGKVYVMLTNNSRRKPDQVDGPNARAGNIWGQIIEMTPPDADHGALRYRWDILVQCGDPADPAAGATWNRATTKDGWFACPDNCTVDASGRLWVSTDQGSGWAKASGTADGLWALETEGPARGTGRMFFRVPVGAELCGPRFSPDDKALFLAVQHPATDGVQDYKPFGKSASTYEDPATRWPDFDPKMPPRPSVVVVTKKDGGIIGS